MKYSTVVDVGFGSWLCRHALPEVSKRSSFGREARPDRVLVRRHRPREPDCPRRSSLQAFRKQRGLTAIDPLNEAPHPIPPQIARESYREKQNRRCVFTQAGSIPAELRRERDVRVTPISDRTLRRERRSGQQATLLVSSRRLLNLGI